MTGIPISASPSPASTRLHSIDALRGLVMLIMLLDHVRETIYLHAQVGDPMNVTDTPPELFFSRLLAHICAPVFVFLTGLSAWLYGQKAGSLRDTSAFLAKRGLFLVALEFTLINFAWTFQFPPNVIYLQVIWAIGLSMLALALLVHLPRLWLIIVGVALVAGHNLLDAIHVAPGEPGFVIWAILHDRGWLEVSESLRLRTSYPVLPWIGVIALGYACGPWFRREVAPATRRRWLCGAGVGAIALFVVLRAFNTYGQAQGWSAQDDGMRTLMSFVNITKYPPSLFFLLLTLGLGLLLLAWLERLGDRPSVRALCVYGAAPLFFYVLHLYVLKMLYLAAVAIWGTTHGQYFGVDDVSTLWLMTVLLAVALYLPVRAFGRLKARRRDIAWLKYL